MQGTTSGIVVLGASSAGKAGSWPLPPGTSWTAYLLANGGTEAVASVPFSIQK